MIMLTSLLGLTNGYITVCVLTEAPKGYRGGEPEICVFRFLFCFQVLTC
ncbi:equilibrative nucleoside transporter [Musa troglodytarum]|uniref:Equilibrative nucleoside transporter n=1 Tax=Musa troglodytarum TaxID=320322 RepID=A0A9E7GP88_9LILI|nr:equilibrative nucleoside transporter [Musa troglodytarum]